MQACATLDPFTTPRRKKMIMLLARIAPARTLDTLTLHSGAGVAPADCRWVTVSDTEGGRAFLQSAWDLGYAILNLGEVSPGWGIDDGDLRPNYGYTVPNAEDVPCVA